MSKTKLMTGRDQRSNGGDIEASGATPVPLIRRTADIQAVEAERLGELLLDEIVDR